MISVVFSVVISVLVSVLISVVIVVVGMQDVSVSRLVHGMRSLS